MFTLVVWLPLMAWAVACPPVAVAFPPVADDADRERDVERDLADEVAAALDLADGEDVSVFVTLTPPDPPLPEPLEHVDP
jgi:hypothetical protein